MLRWVRTSFQGTIGKQPTPNAHDYARYNSFATAHPERPHTLLDPPVWSVRPLVFSRNPTGTWGRLNVLTCVSWDLGHRCDIGEPCGCWLRFWVTRSVIGGFIPSRYSFTFDPPTFRISQQSCHYLIPTVCVFLHLRHDRLDRWSFGRVRPVLRIPCF